MFNIFNKIKDKLVYGKDVSAVKNYVETKTIDKLCSALNCRIEDIMEVIPDIQEV